jgi:hypothetical protein
MSVSFCGRCVCNILLAHCVELFCSIRYTDLTFASFITDFTLVNICTYHLILGENKLLLTMWTYNFSYRKTQLPVTMAVQSEAWVLASWLLGSWVKIPLKAWMFVRIFLCCVVLCR